MIPHCISESNYTSIFIRYSLKWTKKEKNVRLKFENLTKIQYFREHIIIIFIEARPQKVLSEVFQNCPIISLLI